MTRKQIATWLIGALLLLGGVTVVATAVTRAMDLPPSDGRSLTAIVQSVEREGLGAIRSVEYERDWWRISGLWEITVCKENCFELYIDSRTGEERHRRSKNSGDELPPANTQGPSVIAKSFEDGKLGHITEIEFEQGVWQVEYREARGLVGALQPTKRRVFTPAPVSFSKELPVPPAAPPANSEPREPFLRPSEDNQLGVGIAI